VQNGHGNIICVPSSQRNDAIIVKSCWGKYMCGFNRRFTVSPFAVDDFIIPDPIFSVNDDELDDACFKGSALFRGAELSKLTKE
jgi:hypothetical protein